MLRKVVAIWVIIIIIVGSIVILVDIAENVEAPYIPHDPIRINSNGEFASMAGSEGWMGDGSPQNPYIIEGYDINGSGYGYCIYIGNTTVNFEVKDSFLHEASGVESYPYFSDTAIILYNVQNGILYHNNASTSDVGVLLHLSNNNTIANNNVSSNIVSDIFLIFSSDNNIANNTAASNNPYGIYLESSNGNIISNNTATNGNNGIYVENSTSNIISNNTLLNNIYGVLILDSIGNTLVNNNMVDNGIYIIGDLLEHWNTHIIDTTNMVNGKPVQYWRNRTGGIVPEGAGQIILANSTNIVIENQNVSNSTAGIILSFSNGNILDNNTASSNNHMGIYLSHSSNNNITSNIASYNGLDGIVLYKSSNNTVAHNNASSDNDNGLRLISSEKNIISHNNFSSNFWLGIYLISSTNNTISNNTIAYHSGAFNYYTGIYLSSSPYNNVIANDVFENEDYGIYLESSSYCNVTENTIYLNGGYSIYIETSSYLNVTENNISNGRIRLDSSSNNVISENILIDNYFGIDIWPSSNNNTITDNIVNICQFEGITISSSSNYNIVTNNIVSNCEYGIYLGQAAYNTLENNSVISNTYHGIRAFSSSHHNEFLNNIIDSSGSQGLYLGSTSYNNTIVGNTVSNNSCGINLSGSPNNKVYHNNIVNNSIQGFDETNNLNQWDDGYPSGGNYWSDYIDIDDYYGPDQDLLGSDGIWDHNYSIDSNSLDRYPLVYPYLKNSMFLYFGWNLISLPYLMTDPDLGAIFSSITGSYDAVQWYDTLDSDDHWKHNHTQKPQHLNDLHDVNHTMGIWIHITDPNGVLLKIPGNNLFENQTMNLNIGWNLVGYPSLSINNRTTGLNNLEFDSDIDCIQWYDATTKTWHFMGPDDVFVPGRGYWMHSKVDATWEVPI
jgi:parallel beta-helix repeat protein